MEFLTSSTFLIAASLVVLAVVVALINQKVSNIPKPEKGEKGDKGDMGLMGEGLDLPVVDVKIVNNKIREEDIYAMPKQATLGSAAIDLQACIDEPIEIKAGESVLVGTGIAIHVKDPNFAGLILPRSGLGSKSGIVLGNLVGLIDSDYQGELMVSVWNRSWEDYTLQPATRFAQYTVVPVMTPRLRLVKEFGEETARGAKGFGSTGL